MKSKKEILSEVFEKVMNHKKHPNEFNYDHFKECHFKLNPESLKSDFEVEFSFLEMCFAVYLRETTIYNGMSRSECDYWFKVLLTSRV